jgi:diguanylate cyclase (GGDEF)-like protein/PAS domain S-box-containing protein
MLKPALAQRWIRWALCALIALSMPAWATDKVFRYGVYENAPKIFTDKSGQAAGIFVDLMNAIAAEQGWQLQPVGCEWSKCLQMLEAGEIDWMPDVASSPDRVARFDFHTEPVLHSWSQIYARPGDKLDSLLDLKGKGVCVLRDSVQEQYLTELKQGLGVNIRILPVEAVDRGFQMVASGQADAVLSSHHYGDTKAGEFALIATPIILQPAALFIAVNKALGLQAELHTIDAQLKAWKADDHSIYYRILNKWSGGTDTYRLPRLVVWTLAGVALALLVLLLLSFMLKRQVMRITTDLRTSRDELNTILDSVGAHVYIKDTELRYQYANKPAQELWGKSLADIKGQKDDAFFDQATARKIAENDQWVLTNGERLVTEELNSLRRGPGAQFFLSVKIPLRDAHGHIYGLCGISTDLTGNKQAQDEIQALAYYDALTHLPNRRLLMDRLEHSLAVHKRNHRNGALIVINLDAFSLLNNTLGHDVGDRILMLIAQRLIGTLRSEDTVSRASGDEFVVLLNDLSADKDEAAEQTQAVIQKVRQTLAQDYPVNSHRQTVSACIGVAFFTDGNKDADEIFRLADLALHQAKAEGPGSLRFFNHAMQLRAQTRALLESDMRTSLARCDFFLEYQPQIGSSGQVLGAEALLRWRHPTRGLVAPGEFIEVAESSYLILPLGRWVLEQACAQIVRWAQDPTMATWTLAVNVSSRQFQQEDFVEEVLAILDTSKANPHRLELELTESILVSDMPLVEAKMRRLAERGVRFSLDDFGTGYSSLNYLKRLPLRKVKIDKSFIDELPTNAQSAAIVKSMVSLAQNLGMDVIAEGVETEDQVDALRALGRVEYQGFWFGKPMPATELAAWYRQHQQRWLSPPG